MFVGKVEVKLYTSTPKLL